eukprot:Pgem_evm1s17647
MLLYVIPMFLAIHMNFVKPVLDFKLSTSDSGFKSLSAGAVVGLIYKKGLMLKYLLGYAFMLVIAYSLILLFNVYCPQLKFHFHHYTLALVLLPFTSFPTRISVVCQSVLLGVFINGVAAYGFDSLFMLSGV